jgi:ABC-2 type transport system permease protein
VNWQHLQAFVWLRWRLLVNQLRRAGFANAVLLTMVTVGLVLLAIPLFIGAFMVGRFVIPQAAPEHLLYAGDGVVLAFLFFWCIGLITELQRTEPLALSRFLHLPVSVNGAFLINYLSSLCRLSLIVFGPIMLGFALALIVTSGIFFLPTLFLLAAFFLMVSALTYQLQGWLAALMSNPRRRRTVIVVATMIFVLLVQLPNLINILGPWSRRQRADQSGSIAEEMNKLGRAVASKEIDQGEFERRVGEIRQHQESAIKVRDRQTAERWQQGALIANVALPFGWLPLGVMSMAQGRMAPALLGLAGMTLIGAGSLYRAYRTTLGLYQGAASNKSVRRTRPISGTAPAERKRHGLIVEATLPGVSEPVSVIALAGFRSLLRSPEAKMMLLSPLIMIPIFGSMLWRGRQSIPEPIRPLIAIGGMTLVLLGMMQLMANQFGFDRDGFRVFVLSSARRRDVLFGKNLAFAPVALGIALLLLILLQALCPMRLDHLLATIPQYIAMFLLYCLLMNLLSILTPVYVAPGSLKPSNPKITTVFIQLAMVFFLLPLTIGPTLLPLGTEALLRFLGWPAAIPTFLILSLVQLAIVAAIYFLFLELEGNLFQSREQLILDTVTSRAP